MPRSEMPCRTMKEGRRKDGTSDDNAMTSKDFDEVFTIYIGAAGKPVRRRLRAMTADEVLAAMQWNSADAHRLMALADHCDMEDHIAAFQAAKINRDEFKARTDYVIALQDAAIAAMQRRVRLYKAVLSTVPEHARDMKMYTVLRRYWPGGRHAA